MCLARVALVERPGNIFFLLFFFFFRVHTYAHTYTYTCTYTGGLTLLLLQERLRARLPSWSDLLYLLYFTSLYLTYFTFLLQER